MDGRVRFEPVAFPDIEEGVRRHLAALPGAIDSFLEDHILGSAHYHVVIAGDMAGFASIHQRSLITQFALDETFQGYGQEVFGQLRRMEEAQSAFVPTCDGFFLAHALDDYRQLARQAYFFVAPRDPEGKAPGSYALRLATQDDAPCIRQESGDFFEPIARYVEAGELSLTIRHDKVVGFGLLEISALYDDVASIGMYTIERHRRTGVGTATIALLMAECRRRGLRPVAGCWYYNHASKRTLERAGMASPTRLLKIDF